MQCPECQFEKSEDSNFCLEWDQKLEQKCPQYAKALPVRAKFYNGCGYKLAAKSTQYIKTSFPLIQRGETLFRQV